MAAAANPYVEAYQRQHPTLNARAFAWDQPRVVLEAGVDVNVIRGWLGHVSLNTTHRYAGITMRMKAEALALWTARSGRTPSN